MDRLLSRRALLGGAPGLPLLLSRSRFVQDQIDAGPGHVELSAGRLNQDLVIRSRIHLEGAGVEVTSVRTISSEGAGSLWGSNAAEGPTNFSVSRLTVEGARYHGILLYAYGFRLEDLLIKSTGLDGLASGWASGLVTPDVDQVESHVISVKVHHAARTGVAWDGPANSHWSGVDTFHSARGFHLGPNGNALQAVNCHAWARTQDWGWVVEAPNVHFANCLGEGGTQGAFWLLADGAKGDIWAFGVPAEPTKGIEIGDADTTVSGSRLTVTVENCVNGAVALTNDGGNTITGDVRIDGDADEVSPYPVIVGAGSPRSKIELHDARRGTVYLRQPQIVSV